MRIAIVSFPINDVGGINSYCENLIWGLNKIGHSVQYFYMTGQKKLHMSPTEKVHKGRFSLLPGIHMSYQDPESVDVLDSYDLVIFIHPSPHPTKANMRIEDPEAWMDLYECKPPIIQIHHDRWWKRTNSWIIAVAPRVRRVIAAQRNFVPAVKEYPVSDQRWTFFPLPIFGEKEYVTPLADRYPRVIIPTSWATYKRHRKFLPFLEDLSEGIELNFYGGGIEYHTCKRDGLFRFIKDVKNGDAPGDINYWGFTQYEDIQSEMRQSLISLDLSDGGMTNMTHWEPLIYGTMSLMHLKTFSDPYNMIPKEARFWFEDWSMLPNVLESMVFHPEIHQQNVNIGRDFVYDHCRPEEVAAHILKGI